MLRLLAREHPVGELECAWARQRDVDETVQLTARSELIDHTLEDAVTNDRASDLLGQRSGERSVDDTGDLRGREHFVRRRLQLVAPDSRGRPRGEQRRAPGCVAQP